MNGSHTTGGHPHTAGAGLSTSIPCRPTSWFGSPTAMKALPTGAVCAHTALVGGHTATVCWALSPVCVPDGSVCLPSDQLIPHTELVAEALMIRCAPRLEKAHPRDRQAWRIRRYFRASTLHFRLLRAPPSRLGGRKAKSKCNAEHNWRLACWCGRLAETNFVFNGGERWFAWPANARYRTKDRVRAGETPAPASLRLALPGLWWAPRNRVSRNNCVPNPEIGNEERSVIWLYRGKSIH